MLTVVVLSSIFLMHPVLADTSVDIAASYIIKGDNFMAQKMYHDALGMYDAAVAYDPYNSMAWNKLGMAHMRTGRYEDAVYSFEKAIAIDGVRLNFSDGIFAFAITLMVFSLSSIRTPVQK
jgi:tetratricopeptide (TPR) repeat protein